MAGQPNCRHQTRSILINLSITLPPFRLAATTIRSLGWKNGHTEIRLDFNRRSKTPSPSVLQVSVEEECEEVCPLISTPAGSLKAIWADVLILQARNE